MSSFIRAVEVWRLDREQNCLVFGDGFYGPLSAFREASMATRFELDEGLPGKAWAQRHPIILKEFEGSYFKRTEAARAAGLTCGVALPIFSGADLKAVVVFLCGADETDVGAIELWAHDPQRSPGMKFVEGYFGVAEALELTARNVEFRRGFGLPGMVWMRDQAVFLPNLGEGFRFLRANDARRMGVTTGLGIPCQGDPDNVWVMTFLSALNTPIAQRHEIWVPDKTGGALVFQAGDCSMNPAHAKELTGAKIPIGNGIIGAAWRDGVPKVDSSLAGDETIAGVSARSAGHSTLFALPIYSGKAISSVVAMYF